MLVCNWEVLSLLHGGDDNYGGGCDDAVTMCQSMFQVLHTHTNSIKFSQPTLCSNRPVYHSYF